MTPTEADACNVIFVGTVDRNRQVVVKVGQGEGWCCARRLMLVFHFLDQMQCEEDPPLLEIPFLTFLSALGWGLKLCENMSLAHGHSRLPPLLITKSSTSLVFLSVTSWHPNMTCHFGPTWVGEILVFHSRKRSGQHAPLPVAVPAVGAGRPIVGPVQPSGCCVQLGHRCADVGSPGGAEGQ